MDDDGYVKKILAGKDSHEGMTRRSFLGSLSTGVAATILMMPTFSTALSEDKTSGSPVLAPDGSFSADETFFAEFAKTFTIAPRDRYFTAAQKGSMPVPIMKRYKEGLDQVARDPFPVYLEPSEETRKKIARCYGANTDEIAISRNTTDAVAMILSGIGWKLGDELLTSTMEYPNCVATILRVAARFGITIREFGVPMHPSATAEEVIESARLQIRPGKTKVIFFSAITQSNGQMIPPRRMAKLAQQYGLITVVDGAHYGGMFDPKLNDIGIDFWGISGHKWQCGPGGTGILYVRNSHHSANPAPLPRFHLIRSGQLDAPLDGSRPADFDIGNALSIYGFPESADWRALGEVCELWNVIGRQRIQNYILDLADYLRQRLVARFGDGCMLQPTKDPELKSGIVAFTPFADPSQRRDYALAETFQERMFKEHFFHIGLGGLDSRGLTRAPSPEAAAFFSGCIPNRHSVTNAPEPSDIPFRASTGVWLTRRDIDVFVEACEETSKNLGSR
ncbi:MAG: aminotransferase class V-fold PLP-dependent enzyme [Deltaproteobacteria bacterium]|nr:aminotransferase class V-fold PLP-dependent enzyme [Deltaproteobacteria bacterium]